MTHGSFTGLLNGTVLTAKGKRLPMTRAARTSSPTGYAWGYGGSGPFALAHSLLAYLFDAATADRHAQAFKWAVIAALPHGQPFALPYADVRAWVAAHETPAPVEQTVYIPSCEDHEGLYGRFVTVEWVCPVCGGPRGRPYETVSYDGSRRLHVSGWTNPCGHVDKYDDVCREADRRPVSGPVTREQADLLTLAGLWSGVYLPLTDPRTPLAVDLEARGLVAIDRTDPAQICVSLVTPPTPAPMPQLTVLPPAAPTIDVSWMRTTVSADEADQIRAALNAQLEAKFGPHQDDDEVIDESEDETLPAVLVGQAAQEIPCETCGTLFWSLDPDHTECDACDEAAALMPDEGPSFEGAIDDMTAAWESAKHQTRILTRDEEGLLEFSEGLADMIDKGAVMLLSDVEARFMDRVCACTALRVPLFLDVAVEMARKLARGGLVTLDETREPGYVYVSAVRPDAD